MTPENNPEVMNQLALKLGLSPELEFYDVYSLDDQDLLSHIPRPALALLVIIPMTPSWNADRTSEDADVEEYDAFGPSEPVIWFKQTIGNACGSIGLLHCAINGAVAEYIQPGSELDRIREKAVPLKREDRAQMLYDATEFEKAHKSLEREGVSEVVPAGVKNVGGHFVSFVKADGRLVSQHDS
jgi:ubiquitin carboxyl-terminal hydrolase L3